MQNLQSPASVLRVKGGRPLNGGPSLSLSSDSIQNEFLHNMQNKSVLRIAQLDTPTLEEHAFLSEEYKPAYPEDVPDADEFVIETVEINAPKIMSAENVFKSYRKGQIVVPVLKGINLNIHTGEFVSIIGQSGSGKSTLLHLLGTLDVPDEGLIHFDSKRIDNVSREQRDLLRNRHFGMIFQFYHLLSELTTLENVLMPLMIRHGIINYWRHKQANIAKATSLLERVGLSHRLHHKPSELSGGEMQRAAIARALISEPTVLLADEPTGNLDAVTAKEILQLLREMNIERHLTVVLVTHDMSIADRADRIVRLKDGKIE